MPRKPAATFVGAVCPAHPALGGLRVEYARKCVECVREWNRRSYQKNLERNREKRRAHAAENRETNTQRALAWAKTNAERHARNTAKWREENPERAREHSAAWVKKNLHVCAARESKKRAEAKQATPAWANEFFISEAYRLAKLRSEMLGFEWQVDHIVPLRSKLVCGLHCEANLQVIPARVNAAKGNRYWPDMPRQSVA